MATVPNVTIERGSILAYRIFDAGDFVSIAKAEALVPEARRLDMRGPLTEGLVIPTRPLEIEVGPCKLTLDGLGQFDTHVVAHVFDFGAVSFLYEIAIAPGTSLASLTPLCDALYDSEILDRIGVGHRRDLMKKLEGSIAKPHEWTEAESFTIVFAEKIAGANLEELAQSEIVAKLLLGETSEKTLSRAVRDDVLKNAFSYFVDDVAIVDWNSALVVEPSGSRLVPHVLELATSQLLEFRFYDGILDRELSRAYDYAALRPRILKSPFGARTRESLRRFMELTEITERVDNAIKSVGDFYLTRVYLAAIKRFRVPEWRESVETKLALVGRAYELLKGEVEVSRTQLLELTVVALIVAELFAALRNH